MNNERPAGANLTYIIVVALLTFILPGACCLAEIMMDKNAMFSFELMGKWFIFSAVGLRLLLAGIKQSADPAFTAQKIFNIETPESFPIVRELGFANICFGLIGIVSLFIPQWRIVSAFGSGIYYGIAGLQHLLKKPAGINEQFALVTDVLIFIFLLAYFIQMF